MLFSCLPQNRFLLSGFSPPSLDDSSVFVVLLILLFLLNFGNLEDPKVLVLFFTNYTLFLNVSFISMALNAIYILMAFKTITVADSST